MTLNKLEEFLIDFKGCLLLVSHDRYFLDKTVDHMFVFDGEGIISDFPGNYSQYRTKLDAVEKDEKTTIREEKKKTDESNLTKLAQKKKLSFSEKKEFESLEKEIEVLEEEKAKLVEFMDSGSQDYEALTQASVRISELMEAIDNKTLRWLELEELS
jgi:ATP-binding cassette subfamily F protein uup